MSVTVMPRDTPWCVDDLDHLPDDGQRYELIDGELLVSAAPSLAHQDAVGACYRLLHRHRTPPFKVYVAPVDFRPSRQVCLRPDVLVVHRDALGVRNLTVAPRLTVEVLSDSTRAMDLINKREAYQRHGVLSYWIIDPDTVTLTAYDLVNGVYRRAAEVQGTRTATLDLPFTVTVCPADLIAGR